MLPDHSQTILGHFRKHIVLGKQNNKHHENLHRPENRFVLGNNENTKDAYRYDSILYGPMSSPPSMWSPFVYKCALNKHMSLFVIIGHTGFMGSSQ